jgi:hypothetical protein
MKTTTSACSILAICLSFGSCASSPQPRPQLQAQPIAADNGQPQMQAALAALQQAKGEIEAAAANKGGHRAKALAQIQQAIGAVNAGIQYAAAHPTEVGPMEGPAAPEPVDEVVPEAGRQPHMAKGIIALREARQRLVEAKHDKGGFRVQALGFIQQAIVQVREGIRFANTH